MIEIERKFRVTSNAFKTKAIKVIPIIQGYLNSDPERSVRIRLYGESAVLTVKGKSSETGLSRLEWEKEITTAEAKSLLPLCETPPLEKLRYKVPFGDHMYEVDVFSGVNSGLVLAEIELSSEDEQFAKPEWLGQEVSGDPKYYNTQLSMLPFSQW